MNPQLMSHDEVRTRLVTLAELVKVLARDVLEHRLRFGPIASAKWPSDPKKNGQHTKQQVEV